MKSMSKQCDIVRDILPLYVDECLQRSKRRDDKRTHLNRCADCNAIYQKLLSHTSEDVLHEESERDVESVEMYHYDAECLHQGERK